MLAHCIVNGEKKLATQLNICTFHLTSESWQQYQAGLPLFVSRAACPSSFFWMAAHGHQTTRVQVERNQGREDCRGNMHCHRRISILGLRHTCLRTPGKVGLVICCGPIGMVTCECKGHMDSIFRTVS